MLFHIFAQLILGLVWWGNRQVPIELAIYVKNQFWKNCLQVINFSKSVSYFAFCTSFWDNFDGEMDKSRLRSAPCVSVPVLPAVSDCGNRHETAREQIATRSRRYTSPLRASLGIRRLIYCASTCVKTSELLLSNCLQFIYIF